jgi:hypothetical protein
VDIVKITISCWVKGLIKSTYEKVGNDDMPHLTHKHVQARELRAMATSLAFHQRHSLRQAMEAASWEPMLLSHNLMSGICLQRSLTPPWVL